MLSWDAVRGGATSDADGHNVVLHEFAHQLDQEDGAADGAPILEKRAAYGAWAKVLGEEYATLQKDVDDGVRSDIDAYGATNPAEFFAVVTETFFEKPQKLASNHPELYDQLVAFYKQDPLARLGVDAATIERKPRERAPAPIAAAKPSSEVLVCDMSNHAGAARLVKVGEPLREQMRALGFSHAGFVGTLFEGEHPWAWVGEVLRGPHETTTCVLSNIGRYGGDGLSFWTVLENGTMISTETSRVRPIAFRVGRIIPMHHPREHIDVVSLALAPGELLAAHRARVERIAAREKSTPIEKGALELYLAVRIRTAALRQTRLATFTRARTVAFWIVFALVAVGTLAMSFVLAGLPVVGQKLGVFVALACSAGVFAGVLARDAVARVVVWRTFGSAPIPSSELFARAAKLDHTHAARIEALMTDE